MFYRSSTGAFALAAALMMTLGGAQAADDAKYPNWKGQWDTINPRLGGQTRQVRSQQGVRTGAAGAADAGVSEDPRGKHGRPGQGRAGQFHRPCPLRAGRHAEHDVGAGGGIHRHAGNHLYFGRTPTCAEFSPTAAPGRRTWSRPIRATRSANGSTRTATASTTCSKSRRAGRSRGRVPTTRPGCRCISTISRPSRSGSIIDKNDPNLLHDEITVFDHALTRPWSVDKTFRRNPNPYPNWSRVSCTEGTNYVVIGTDVYFLSGDGFLMPTKKDQAPPDARYFKRTSN